MLTTNQNLLKELDALQIEVILPTEESLLTAPQVTLPLVKRVTEHQKEDPELVEISRKLEEGKG